MTKNKDIPPEMWRGYHPTDRPFLNGYTWLYFDIDSVQFVLRDKRDEIIENKHFKREDETLREMFG